MTPSIYLLYLLTYLLTVNQLARTFNTSVAEGKRTFYRQHALPELRDRCGTFHAPATSTVASDREATVTNSH